MVRSMQDASGITQFCLVTVNPFAFDGTYTYERKSRSDQAEGIADSSELKLLSGKPVR
jgi:hypothetical protein